MPSRFYLEKIQKEKQSRLLKLKIYGVSFLFFALMAGIAYLIVYSPLFKIKNITLIYADNPETEQARYGAGKLITADSLISDFKNFFASQSKFAQFLGPDNILIWNNEKIDEFLKNYPQWAKILITKDYLEREIKIEIKERERFGIWCQKTQIARGSEIINADQHADPREISDLQKEISEGSASCWWFDKRGILFKEAPSIEGNLINKVDDFSGRSLKVGELALEEKLFSNLIKIFEVLEKSDLKIKSLKLEKLELQEIIADPLNNSFPKIYFSLRIDPKFAMAALESLKNLGLGKIEYIDLRVENRAYYKLK